MLEIYGGMTELYAVVLDHAKRKREAGVTTPGGAVETMTSNLQLRLHLEMLDDDKAREIASKTLDNLANLGQGLAPGPREQEIGREQRQRISRQSTATRESGRSNWRYSSDQAARMGPRSRFHAWRTRAASDSSKWMSGPLSSPLIR